jgi:hypothetical protein
VDFFVLAPVLLLDLGVGLLRELLTLYYYSSLDANAQGVRRHGRDMAGNSRYVPSRDLHLTHLGPERTNERASERLMDWTWVWIALGRIEP